MSAETFSISTKMEARHCFVSVPSLAVANLFWNYYIGVWIIKLNMYHVTLVWTFYILGLNKLSRMDVRLAVLIRMDVRLAVLIRMDVR